VGWRRAQQTLAIAAALATLQKSAAGGVKNFVGNNKFARRRARKP
jgi:hypothetical protein